MDNLLVWKFGGSSVSSVDRIRHVAALIEAAVMAGSKLVVVVSAMGSYTDELLTLAYSLSKRPPERELDMLVTTGERISISLLSIALAAKQVRSLSLTGSQSGILTDEAHGNARIIGIRGDRIIAGLDQVPVVIVAGFQGVSPKTRDITSLGRGGSDLSAVALAIRLQAGRCDIFTDVRGVLSADPDKVSQAKLIRQIPWDVMNDFSWCGAGVLHHRAAHLAAAYRMPVLIRSSFEPEREGTLIMGDSSVENVHMIACAHKEQQCLLTMTGPAAAGTDGFRRHSELLEWLWKREESPLISNFYRDHSAFRMTLLFHEKFADDACDLLRKSEAAESCPDSSSGISLHRGCAAVSLIGSGFRQHPLSVRQADDVTEHFCLFRDLQDRSLNFVIPADKLSETLEKFHSLVAHCTSPAEA
ncbi:MAG: aspartate kinase [Deltaproteobacteria bacterium]|nr:aspartate kinase [Deltaproteobacteria bacterium]